MKKKFLRPAAGDQSHRGYASQWIGEGRPFTSGQQVLFKIAKDPLGTRLGAFLGRFSIDELPQIVDVLLASLTITGWHSVQPTASR